MQFPLGSLAFPLALFYETTNDASVRSICSITSLAELHRSFNVVTFQHAIVNIQLNIVTCPTYLKKFIRDIETWRNTHSVESHVVFKSHPLHIRSVANRVKWRFYITLSILSLWWTFLFVPIVTCKQTNKKSQCSHINVLALLVDSHVSYTGLFGKRKSQVAICNKCTFRPW